MHLHYNKPLKNSSNNSKSSGATEKYTTQTLQRQQAKQWAKNDHPFIGMANKSDSDFYTTVYTNNFIQYFNKIYQQ